MSRATGQLNRLCHNLHGAQRQQRKDRGARPDHSWGLESSSIDDQEDRSQNHEGVADHRTHDSGGPSPEPELGRTWPILPVERLMTDVRSDKDLSLGSPTVTSVAPYIAAGLGHLAAAGNPFDRDFPASSPSPNMRTNDHVR